MVSHAIIQEFDQFLKNKSLSFEGIAVGGTALVLLGAITRATRDLDLLDETIPESILKAAEAFSRVHGLDSNWLNNGPAEDTKSLPKAWQGRLASLFEGEALRLLTLHRSDLIKTKCWALCDRPGQDLEDLLGLKPTVEELLEARNWLLPLDGNPEWPEWVNKQMKKVCELAERSTDHGLSF